MVGALAAKLRQSTVTCLTVPPREFRDCVEDGALMAQSASRMAASSLQPTPASQPTAATAFLAAGVLVSYPERAVSECRPLSGMVIAVKATPRSTP